jgi:hypothetical protein
MVTLERDAWSSLLSSDNVTKFKTKDLSAMPGPFFMPELAESTSRIALRDYRQITI